MSADSATATVLAAGLAGLAASNSAEYLALSSLLALMAAAILILARLILLGFLADFLSRTVLIGFLTGVGIQVASWELGGMLGIPRGGHGTIGKLIHDFQHPHQANFYSPMVAAAVLLTILGSRKISKKIPGPLIAVIVAIILSWAVNLKAYGVAILGPVPRGIPVAGLPNVDWSFDLIINLLPTALSIFLVILSQSAATSRAYVARYNEHFCENTDLVGLSLANLGAGLTGTFVVNGSPTMTHMVDGAGGGSQLAQITASLIVLLILLFLTGPLEFLPGAVLSTVVVLIAVEMIDVQGMRQIYRERPAEFWVALITAVVVIFVGVEQGILLAMFLSLVSHTRHGYRPKNALIVADQPEGWKTQPLATQAQLLPGLLVYRFSHGMYYANAELLSEQVTKLAKEAKPPLVWFCLAGAAIDDIDYSAAATLRSLHSLLQKHGIRLIFSEVSEDVYGQLERSGITELVGQDAFYASGAAVISAYRQMLGAASSGDSEET